MTLTQLVTQENIKLSKSQKSKIGEILRDAAKALNITYGKVEEPIMVADYPSEFIPDMQEIIIGYLTHKTDA